MRYLKLLVRVLISVVIVLVSAVLASILLVKLSPSFRRMLLAKAGNYVGESTGTHVTIQALNLSFWPLRVRLEGIEARRTVSTSSVALITIDDIDVQMRVITFFRNWRIDTIHMRHPVVHIRNEDLANTSTATTIRGDASIVARMFDLEVQQCVIERAELYFKEKRINLDVEVRNLHFNAMREHAPARYRGLLSYDSATIRVAGHTPLPHSLNAEFTLTANRLDISRVAIATNNSRVVAAGVLDNFNNPLIRSTYEADVSVGEIAAMVKQGESADGVIHTTGSMTRQPTGDSLWRSLIVSGQMDASKLELREHNALVRVTNLSAIYRLANANLDVERARGRILGGDFNADLSIRDLTRSSNGSMQVHLRNACLQQLRALRFDNPTEAIPLNGNVSAEARVMWEQTRAGLKVHSIANLNGTFELNHSRPFNAVVDANYSSANHAIELRQSVLRAGATVLTANGIAGRDSRLHVALRSDDLHELSTLATNLSAELPPNPDLHGKASFRGFVTDVPSAPRVEGKLEVTDLIVRGSAWRFLAVDCEAQPSALRLVGSAQAARHGQAQLAIRVGLEGWRYTPASPFTIEGSLLQVRLPDIAPFTAGAHHQSGTISGNISLRGSQLHPVGHAEISVTGAEFFSMPFRGATVRLHGDGKELQADLTADLAEGTIQGTITLNPVTRGYRTVLHARRIELEHLYTIHKDLSLGGSLNVDVEGNGSITKPDLQATLKSSQLRISGQAFQDTALVAHLHNRRASVTLTSGFSQGSIKGEGTIGVEPPYPANFHLETSTVNLRPLLTSYAPTLSGGLQAQGEFRASLTGPLQEPSLVDAHAEIPVFTMSYQHAKLSTAEPVRVEWSKGIVTLQATHLRSTGTDVRLRATIPIHNPGSASYAVEGVIDIGLASALNPQLTAHGQVEINLDSKRHGPGTNSIGEIRLVNASLHTSQLPLGIDDANATIAVGENKLELENCEVQVGGGTLALQGSVALRPEVQFHLGLNGNDIRVRYPEGVRGVFRPELTLVGTQESASLQGRVSIQSLSIARDFDVLRFAHQFEELQSPAPASGFGQHVNLDVNVQSGEQVELASSQVSLNLNADLRVVGTVAKPVVTGRAHLPGGDIFFGGNRYVLQTGTVDFINPLDTEPILNAQVTTRIKQYDISLNLSGPIENLQTTYSSTPSLPPVDIINLLAFGQTTEQGGVPTPFGNLGAESVLAQGLGTAVSSFVQRFAGISYFSISPSLGGTNQEATARVVIQERISSNVIVSYSTDVTSTQSQAIQLEYQLNRHWAVSGTRNENGGFGGTASYSRSF